MISSELYFVLMISTSFIRLAGLKKCKSDNSFSGNIVCSAIPVIEREEVLLAKMVSSVLIPCQLNEKGGL